MCSACQFMSPSTSMWRAEKKRTGTEKRNVTWETLQVIHSTALEPCFSLRFNLLVILIRYSHWRALFTLPEWSARAVDDHFVSTEHYKGSWHAQLTLPICEYPAPSNSEKNSKPAFFGVPSTHFIVQQWQQNKPIFSERNNRGKREGL